MDERIISATRKQVSPETYEGTNNRYPKPAQYEPIQAMPVNAAFALEASQSESVHREPPFYYLREQIGELFLFRAERADHGAERQVVVARVEKPRCGAWDYD